MATHSSILTWRSPWIEEPGRAIIHGVTKSQTHLRSGKGRHTTFPLPFILVLSFTLAPVLVNTMTSVLPSKLGSLRKSVTASLPFKIRRQGIPWQSSG